MGSLNDFKIPKLTEDNYYYWTVRTKAALIHQRCWAAVDPGYGTEEEITAAQRETDQKALSIIFLVVGDLYLNDIGDKARAKDAWDTLREIHTSFGVLHTLLMLREMCTLVKSPDLTMMQYIEKLQNLTRKINSGGVTFSDQAMAMFYLMGLPLDLYEGAVRAIEREANITTSVVKARLLLEEKRLTTTTTGGAESSGSMALIAAKGPVGPASQHKSGPSGQGPNKPYPRVCYFCGIPGHIARFCRKKNEKKEEQSDESEKKKVASVVKNHQSDDSERKQAGSAVKEYRALCVESSVKLSLEKFLYLWFLDSGATHHMCPFIELFEVFQHLSDVAEVANGENVHVKGKGSVKIDVSEDCGGGSFELQNVLYVPELTHNLLSVSAIEKLGCEIKFGHGCAVVSEGGNVLLTARRVGNMYQVLTHQVSFQEREMYNDDSVKPRANRIWHGRMGHASQLPDVLPKEKGKDVCEVCVEGKLRNKSFPVRSSEMRSDNVLDKVHSDVVGKLKPKSLGGAEYFATFIDDHARYISVGVMKRKSETFKEFKCFVRRAEVFHGKELKCIQSDNGGEYLSGDFQMYLADHGISHRKTVPHTPAQNGVAERANQTLLAMVRCMLIGAGLPKYFWAEALSTACFIRNRCPSSALQGQIPYELWNKKKLEAKDLSSMRVFGCQVWAATVDKPKLDSRAKRCVFLGYPEDVKGFRLWDLSERKVIVSRNVYFQEDVFPFKLGSLPGVPLGGAKSDEELNVVVDLELVPAEPDNFLGEVEQVNVQQIDPPDPAIIHVDNEQVHLQQNEAAEQPAIIMPELRRSVRDRKQTKCKMPCCNVCKHVGIDEPMTVDEALSGKHCKEWSKAMHEELSSLSDNNTWELVRRPENKNVVGSRWVFAIKRDEHGEIQRFKARLVAQGYTQLKGVDYQNTFSPVVNRKIIRILLAISVLKDWDAVHLDIKSAYLHSPLKDEVYLEQPPGFEIENRSRYEFVCRLKKSIYGLHQAAKDWNSHLDKLLKEFELLQCVSEPCVYHNVECDLVLAVYVDDITVWGVRDRIEEFKTYLSQRVEVKDLGDISHILSFRVKRPTRDLVTIDQNVYVEQVLKEFNMENCRGLSTPLELPGNVKVKAQDEDEPCDALLYKKLVGCLLYIATSTRPDLAFAACRESRYNTCATMKHWAELKHILRYVKGTENLCLNFSKQGGGLQIFTDADWGSDKEDRKSVSGFVVILAGGAVCWQSRKQKVVAASTAEAEYLAMGEVVREVKWLRNFFHEIGQQDLMNIPCKIYADNQGANCMASNKGTSDRSKHIDIIHHFLREEVVDGKVIFEYVPSNQNCADILTKIVPGPRCKELSMKMGLLP